MSYQGYRTITVGGKQILEHRHIMEQLVGRKLTPKELVHHIDGNKLNNAVSNLEIVCRSLHPALHPNILESFHKNCQPARWKKGTI